MEKSFSEKIRIAISNPRKLAVYLLCRIAPIIPDKLYLQWLFRLRMGYKLNLDNPQTFSEKLQWLKLYNRKPEYTQMVDKVGAKEYVAKIIGEEYIIPTIGVWDSVDDIDFDKLPNQFVLKCTHDSGGIVICKDKSKLDIESARRVLRKGLKRDFYSTSREWPYKNVSRKIIAEEFITDKENEDLPDYKFYCFNGNPKYCQVIRDRNTIETIDFYDTEWNHMPFVGLNPVFKNGLNPVFKNGLNPVFKPPHLEDMLIVCRKLSGNIPFSRIDLYVVGHRIYFGEITFFPASGLGEFTPKEWNYTFGSLIKLPK